MDRDEYYMKMALRLARKGEGRTGPNPMVGAVIVKNGKIVATGYHKRAGSAHAEIEALDKAGGKARGAVLYVNLEPCDHFGRTPPCTDRIIEEGIRRVVIGMRDPNPVTGGRGIRKLKARGIGVRCGCLNKESRELNTPFTKFIKGGRPYVIIKAAQSLDGKIATSSGDSKWISDSPSREIAHGMRSAADAVLVGVNTVIKDDPLLTSRRVRSPRQPVRVILDSALRTPADSRVIKDASSKVIIATTAKAAKKRIGELRARGVDVVSFGKERVALKPLLRYLAKGGISRLLVEGGGGVIASFLKEGLADEAVFFISPRIIGGAGAPTAVEGDGIRSLKAAPKLNNVRISRSGRDIVVRGYVHRNS